MHLDIGYSENRHIDTYIVYIHIYSWDKAVHPPALSWEKTNKQTKKNYTVFSKKSSNYLDPRFYADVVMTIEAFAVDFSDTGSCILSSHQISMCSLCVL